jgi:hypothetical protein
LQCFVRPVSHCSSQAKQRSLPRRAAAISAGCSIRDAACTSRRTASQPRRYRGSQSRCSTPTDIVSNLFRQQQAPAVMAAAGQCWQACTCCGDDAPVCSALLASMRLQLSPAAAAVTKRQLRRGGERFRNVEMVLMSSFAACYRDCLSLLLSATACFRKLLSAISLQLSAVPTLRQRKSCSSLSIAISTLPLFFTDYG